MVTLEVAEKTCTGFERLLSERSSLGSNVDGVNAMILDKLAEVRAVVGLDELGFQNVRFTGSPDLTGSKGTFQYAIEVTRISARGGVREPPEQIEIATLRQGDENDLLWRQLITKALGKRDQMLRAGCTDNNHLIWVSAGRDYFTVGRYEPSLAGLRQHMPRHASEMAERARTDERLKSEYPELACVALSLGRDSSPFLVQVAKDA